MSFLHVFEYLAGIAVFGLVYWLLDGIKSSVEAGVTISGDVYDFYIYVWVGSIIIYLLFGGVWLARSYAEWRNQAGGML